MGVFFWGAVSSASLLIVLAITIFMTNYNKATAKFAAAFFTFGLFGLMFIYFGVHKNMPHADVKGRIVNGINELAIIQNELTQKKERIDEEVELVYERNLELQEQFAAIAKLDSTLNYNKALLDPQINSILKFLQYNVANIEKLKLLRRDLEVRSNEIELNRLEVQAQLIEWETSGGINGDLDGYLLEEKLSILLTQFKSKISSKSVTNVKLKPISEVWGALTKSK